MKLLFALFLLPLVSVASETTLSGKDLFSGQTVTIPSGKKGSVLVFLSAKCPCSNSHVQILKKLASDFPDFSFAAVHSNSDEDIETTKKYFQTAALPFSVLQDEKAKLANDLKAIKTPHAFLFSPDHKILYKGGVTNSSAGSDAAKQFLRDALADAAAGRDIKVAEGRTLGCVIAR